MRFIGGKDGMVLVVSDGRKEFLASRPFEWGVKPATPRCIDLAKAILTRVIPDDQVRVTRLYMRFMHRCLTQGLKPGVPWTLTGENVLAVINEIEQAERDGAQIAAAMVREMPRIPAAGPQFPGHQGYGGNDTAPDRKR